MVSNMPEEPKRERGLECPVCGRTAIVYGIECDVWCQGHMFRESDQHPPVVMRDKAG